MQRPPSIVMFERLYLGSFVLWLINNAVFWNATQDMLRNNPQMAGNPVLGMMPSIMIGSIIVSALVTLLLWYLVARKASVVAKWFVVVFEVLGVLAAVFAIIKLASGQTPNAPMTIVGLVVTALAVAAAVMLFRPDARAWLGETAPAPGVGPIE